MYAWTLCGSFPCDSPPKSVNKGARFWGFPRFRGSGVHGENPSIPLNSTSFGGPNRSYGIPPKSCANPWSESGDRDLDLEELTRELLFTPSYPRLTGLTSACDRCDGCKVSWNLPRVNCLICVSLRWGVAGQFLVGFKELC
jgi:hypothetical protein